MWTDEYGSWTRPTDFCKYFWQVYLIVLLFPIVMFTWTGKRISFIGRFFAGVLAYLGLLFVFMFGVAVFDLYLGYDTEAINAMMASNWWGVPLVFLAGVIHVALLFLVFFLGGGHLGWWISKQIKKHKQIKKPSSNIIIQKIKAYKEKTCPMIEWTDEGGDC